MADLNLTVEDVGFLIELLSFLISIIVGFVMFFKTKDLKYLKEILKEMKFKTNQTAIPAAKNCVIDLKDTDYKPVYRLNTVTGELEETDELINIAELINSCRDYALQACLERFFPADEDAQTVLESQYNDDLSSLDEYTNLMSVIADYREELNLPFATDKEVMDAVQARAKATAEKLNFVKKEKKENEEEV